MIHLQYTRAPRLSLVYYFAGLFSLAETSEYLLSTFVLTWKSMFISLLQVARREKAIQKLELELLTAQENHRRALDDVRITPHAFRTAFRIKKKFFIH